jgi:AcrR family transcriptional regulator
MPTDPSERMDRAEDLNNRARLLRAAADAFARNGYNGVSLRGIAEEAGVSFQLITYYFGTKEGIWEATVDFLYERYLETGKGLGFTLSGDVHEQFRNHLRMLLTDQLQRPQLRMIYMQERLADSDRYARVIQPKVRYLHEVLSLPYFQEVARLGITKAFEPEKVALLWAAVAQLNVSNPYYVELLLGLPTGSAESIELQVDLVYDIVTSSGSLFQSPVDVAQVPELAPESTAAEGAQAAETHVSGAGNQRRLEMENRHLKQLVGSLSLERAILLDMLRERDSGEAER